jgi:hypothetical protein
MVQFPASIRRRLNQLARSERGMALPVALFAMISSVALAGAAVTATVDVQLGSHRDSDSKRAIQAADAGANIARLRLNRYATVVGPEAPCLMLGTGNILVGTTQVEADGWCPEVTGTVGSATYSYRISPVGSSECSPYDLCVVSTGTVDDVSRRVEVSYNSDGSGGANENNEENENEGEETQEEKEQKEKELEEQEEEAGNDWSSGVGIDGVIGVDHVEIDNNADARVSVGTNGEVYVHNNGNVCGNIRHGIGNKATFENNGTQCDGYTISEGNLDLPPVSSFMPADIATNNSNYRLFKCAKTSPVKEPTGCQSDTYSKSWSSTKPWNPSTRTIETSNNATLTLGGGDYFICRLELSNNSHLIMADGATVRVFFDTPENCGLSSGSKQIDVSNNANITSTGYQPTLGEYELPGFYLLGSTSISTKVEWSNNSGTNEFILYAPNSDIELKNNATFHGIVAGKTVHLQNNAVVIQDPGFAVPEILNPWKDTSGGGGEGESEEEEGGSEEETEKEEEETGEQEETPPAAIYFTPQAFVECSGLAQPGSAPNTNC